MAAISAMSSKPPRNAGHEVWLQAPMEAVVGADPGPHTLEHGREAKRRTSDSLHWLMGRFVGYVGVVNYLGVEIDRRFRRASLPCSPRSRGAACSISMTAPRRSASRLISRPGWT